MELVLTVLLFVCGNDLYCKKKMAYCVEEYETPEEITREVQSEVFQYCFDWASVSEEE